MQATLKIALLGLVLTLSEPVLLHAQQAFKFEHLTTADGLATNTVNTIFQDAQGFMWFGTGKGLHKYDGYRFTIYQHDEDDPHSLSHNNVSAIDEDREGVLWVGTRDGGFNRFDRATETFTHYRHDDDDPHSLGSDDLISLCVDRDGMLWIGTFGNGMDRFDPTTETFTHYRYDPNDPNSLGSSRVFSIYEDRSGTLWTGGLGLNRFDRSTETFTRYPVQDTTYHQEVFRFIESLEQNRRRVASLLHVGDDQDLAQTITLTEETSVLLVAMGEAVLQLGGRSPARWIITSWMDYGWLEDSTGKVVWEMEPDRARHAGWILRDRIQIGLKTLAPGTYRLRYKSDIGTSYQDWMGMGPTHPELWGIQLFHVTEAEARRIEDYLDQYELPNATSGAVYSIYEDRTGLLWLGTNNGLNRFDPETETFTPYKHDPNNPRSLSSDWLRAVLGDRDGVLWIGGTIGPLRVGSRGLTRFDPMTNTFTRFPYDPLNPHGFVGNQVRDLYEDRAGALWIATRNDGIQKLDPAAVKFTAYRYDPRDPGSLSHSVVWAVHESRDGTLWIGTEDGLDRLDRLAPPTSEARITHFRHDPADPSSLSHPMVKAILEDRDGVLWVGTGGGGLNRFDPTTETFTRYRHDPEDPASISGDAIDAIYEDSQGMLWVGAWTGADREHRAGYLDGLDRFDRETGAFTHYTHDPNDSTSLSSGEVTAIFEDSRGVLWIGTRHGLSLFDRATGRFRRYLDDPSRPPANTGIFAIREDRTGRLWVGGGGLFLLDRETGAFESFTEEEGIPFVNGLVIDEANNLWLSTDGQGIARFNPDTETIRTYDLTDGLPGLRYNRSATFQNENGEIFFGGRGGVVAFHPDEVIDNPYVPPVVLTGMTLRNKPVSVGEDAPLKAHISVAESVTLAYNQNDVAFEFVALNYRHPEKNRYAYLLEGYDDDWIEAGTSRQARYTNLPPGDYIFRVRGANNDGLWNEDGAAITVVVTPPLWQTWWFRLFALVSMLALAYAGYRGRVRSLEERAQILEAQVAERTVEVRSQAEKLQELDRIKSRFFANISHEFRTPLTLMLGPLHDVLDGAYGPVSEPLRQQHTLMQRSGKRLLRLINQLLDLSKLEAGQMTLRARRADLVPLLRATVQVFESMAHRQHVALQIMAPPREVILYFEPDKLEKVLFNLLSNAFKFTPEGGTIEVRLEEEGGEERGCVEIVVRDTGRGIPAEELPYVFDRFHQVDASSTREREGTGIGLALTKELLALHGGTIRVESELGRGTTFFIRLPKGRAHLHDDDIVGEDRLDMAPTVADLEAIHLDTSIQAVEEVLASEERLHEPTGNGQAAPPDEAPTILIVEDNADVRNYLKGHLAADYHVVEAVDGIDGLAQAQAIVPDLVLSDVMMPRMDGYALCRALKTDAALGHIPVVLLTARADEESKVKGLETGADDYLYKPFNAEELLVRVENLIEIRRQLRARFSETVIVKPSDIEITSADAAFLEHVRVLVEEQLGDGAFSVEMLAAEVGLSRRQLDRRLKGLTKLSASGFIRKMRLERAAQLLEQGAGNVSEVAQAVGFQHPWHFTKLFHQAFGVPPSEYSTEDT